MSKIEEILQSKLKPKEKITRLAIGNSFCNGNLGAFELPARCLCSLFWFFVASGDFIDGRGFKKIIAPFFFIGPCFGWADAGQLAWLAATSLSITASAKSSPIYPR